MEKKKIGIIGLNFGSHVLKGFKNGQVGEYFELDAVCDRDEPKCKQYAKEYGVKAYTNLSELLADDDIPVVGLFTGPKGRADLLSTIIRAGKDVMTTKPFELDADAGLKVLKEAKELGRVIHLNSPSPLPTGEIIQIEEWVSKYNLGRPIAARRDDWASYRETATGTWQDDPDSCPVAPIFRLGIYVINDFVRLFGEADEVQVTHSSIFTGRPTPDNAQLSIKFKSGAIANIFCSFCINDGMFYTQPMILNYENGTIFKNTQTFPYAEGMKNLKMSIAAASGKGESVLDSAEPGSKSGDYMWDVFYRAINGEKMEGEIEPEMVVAGIRIIEAMHRAEKSGKTEKVL